MSSKPLVSVVIPSYNHAKYIEQALRSVIDQTYPNLEIIVIDDGSSDGSPELIDAVASKSRPGRRFELRCRPNKGAPATINEGLELSTGAYLAILNSDDYYTLDRIETFVECALRSGTEFLYSEVILIDESGTRFQSEWYDKCLRMASLYPTPSFYLLKENITVTTGNFFFSRDLFEKVGTFSNLVTCHDWEYALRCLLHAEPLFVRQEKLHYRMHGSNTIRRKESLLAEETRQALTAYLTLVSENKLENHLAPCYRNWGAYWTRFVDAELRELNGEPRLNEILF